MIFVEPDFAWKTKRQKRTQPEYGVPTHFQKQKLNLKQEFIDIPNGAKT